MEGLKVGGALQATRCVYRGWKSAGANPKTLAKRSLRNDACRDATFRVPPLVNFFFLCNTVLVQRERGAYNVCLGF